MISRFIENQILKNLKPAWVVGIFGPRRAGKTILLETIREKLAERKVLLVQGGDLGAAEVLSSQKKTELLKFTQGYEYLFIDEAQEIPNIGKNLKLLVDSAPTLSIVVTGSSALSLKEAIGEPLTGRSRFFNLFPFAQMELSATEDFLTRKNNLETRLIYGMYPQVVLAGNDAERVELLKSIRDGYLLKDVLKIDNLKDSLFIFNLLRLLAFQLGKDISYTELGQNLNTHPKTIKRYLEILEKVFVIFSLPGFSKNLRSEYTKTPRYYFWDLGIRNILISNMNSLNLRDDSGMLWENFCISERKKKQAYLNELANSFFWRTYTQKEIDLLEERGGKLFGYEFKWGEKKAKKPKLFLETYKEALFEVINKENYEDFVL